MGVEAHKRKKLVRSHETMHTHHTQAVSKQKASRVPDEELHTPGLKIDVASKILQ